MSHLPAIRPPESLPNLLPPATPDANLGRATPVANLARAAGASPAVPTHGFANPQGNLSEAARPVYEALQAAAAFPPSTNPAYMLPSNGNFLRLFSAVQAVAVERIYPAPIFSFTA